VHTKFILEAVDGAFTGVVMRLGNVSVRWNIISRCIDTLYRLIRMGRTTPRVSNTLRSWRMSQPVSSRQMQSWITECLSCYASKKSLVSCNSSLATQFLYLSFLYCWQCYVIGIVLNCKWCNSNTCWKDYKNHMYSVRRGDMNTGDARNFFERQLFKDGY